MSGAIDVGRSKPRIRMVTGAVLGFLAVGGPQLADASHWHNAPPGFPLAYHGLTHGAYTDDGSWFARVDSNLLETAYCVADHLDYGVLSADSGIASCSAWSLRNLRAPEECHGVAVVELNTRMAAHDHGAHERCPEDDGLLVAAP